MKVSNIMGSHYSILSSLYELYKANTENEVVLRELATIAWTLEHELGFESFGYFELSELATYGANNENAKKHYIEVIESLLET